MRSLEERTASEINASSRLKPRCVRLVCPIIVGDALFDHSGAGRAEGKDPRADEYQQSDQQGHGAGLAVSRVTCHGFHRNIHFGRSGSRDIAVIPDGDQSGKGLPLTGRDQKFHHRVKPWFVMRLLLCIDHAQSLKCAVDGHDPKRIVLFIAFDVKDGAGSVSVHSDLRRM